MAAPQLGTDSVELTKWEFSDSVDFDTQSYGTGKCGPKEIVPQLLTSSGDLVDFVQWNPSTKEMVLSPTLATPIDDYEIVYVVRMLTPEYTNTNSQEFLAVVNPCVTTISYTGGIIDDRQTTWGDDLISIDVTNELAQFTQSPACGYSYQIEPKIANIDLSYTPLPLDYTLEYIVDASTNVITAEKCSTRYASTDPDCAGTPFESIYDIVFMVTVDNDPTTLNTDLQFTIQIGNICEND